ncbi:MAG TPA: alpha/beta fold hydrolase [Phycisphaerales bacterium]|nr:alpha/beta fold hydrolase [Phycisphaerales bacterium]
MTHLGLAMSSTGRRWWWVALLVLYCALLAWSTVYISAHPSQPMTIDHIRRTLVIPAMTDSGPVPDQTIHLPYLAWNAATPDPAGVPIVLLHGSPGGADNFVLLGPRLAEHRAAYAIDLPGMGAHTEPVPSRSARAHARALLAFLDAMNIERAHILGWSEGGAVAIRLAELAPERMASMTLLASVGAQRTEGSGSYFFEHTKYKLGDVALKYGPMLVPHFGILGSADQRTSFLKNFLETDQRPFADIMRTTAVPTLILHGRDDFLIADWAAEYHHEIMPTSTLVMTPHDHFMPFLHPKSTAEDVEHFIARCDEPGLTPVRSTIDRAPRATPFGRLGGWFLSWVRFGPWWLVVLGIVLVSLTLGSFGRAWTAVLVGATELDIAVAWVGLTIAELVQMRRRGQFRRAGAWIRAIFRPGYQVVVGFLAVQLLLRPIGEAWGGFGWLISTVALALFFRLVPAILTKTGRRELRTSLTKLRHHEWWPAWTLYGPLVPWFAWLAIRSKHPLALTCCNPGIEPGGGVAGESKSDILTGLLNAGHDAVLYGEPIPLDATPRIRAEHTLRRIQTEPAIGGFPVILKPDRGERGMGVKLCRDERDVFEFFERTPVEAIVQRFHPGPNEIGIFWVRRPRPGSDLNGRIFSVTRKHFPKLVGDGKHSIEHLILNHHRYRCQAAIFLDRFADRLGEVLGKDEHITLSGAGNHAQGAKFTDGHDLITPELEREVDRIASAYRGPNGGELDFGRFDFRYADESELKQGRGLAAVEVNGVTSESTNIYDPSRSIFFAWRTLAAQWSIAYRIGTDRMARGAKPLSLADLLFGTRRHLNDRKDYSIAR